MPGLNRDVLVLKKKKRSQDFHKIFHHKWKKNADYLPINRGFPIQLLAY